MDRILIVLDIDGTLLHAEYDVEQHLSTYTLHYRPGVIDFIKLLQKQFDVAIWTAGSEDYAEFVCDRLFDGLPSPKFIWSHKRCTVRYEMTGLYSKQAYTVKKLSKVPWDINRTLIVDDTPETYKFNYGNAIPITSWNMEDNDDSLCRLGKYIVDEFGEFEGSVRSVSKIWEIG